MLQVSNQPPATGTSTLRASPCSSWRSSGSGAVRPWRNTPGPSAAREQGREPAGGGAAVVVGERDQRRLGRAPAEVALRGRPGDPGQGQVADAELRRGDRERLAGVGVADDDDLEPVRLELAGERLEREREPRLPPAGGDDHRNLGSRRAHGAGNLLVGMPAVRPTIAVVVATHDRPARLGAAAAARSPSRSGPPTRSSSSPTARPPRPATVLAAERARGELPLRTIAAPARGRAGDRPRRGLARQPAPTWSRSPTTTARRRPGWLAAAERAALADPGCFVQGPDAAEPGRDRRPGPFSHTISVARARPLVPDLQHRLPARAARAHRRLRHAHLRPRARAARTATSPGARSRPGRGRCSAPRRSSTTRSTTSARSASCASPRAGPRR